MKRATERGAGPIELRPARTEDLPACCEIWSTSVGDYVRRLNQPWFGGDPEPLRRLLAHFLATDPDRFWVATEGRQGSRAPGGRVVGFGSATRRGSVLFLGWLFIEPKFQGRGLGRALLDRAIARPADGGATGQVPGAAGPLDLALGTSIDSVQPIAAALYSRYGIVPRLPVMQLVGYPERAAGLAGLPSGIRLVDAAADGPGPEVLGAAVGQVDAVVLGHEHPVDHAFLRSEGRRLFLLESERDGIVGYGYSAPSGRFGPLAALDAGLLAPLAVELLRRGRAAGAYAIWVPGAADRLVVTLLEAGLRLESFPALLSWTRPFADFSRYVPINLALL